MLKKIIFITALLFCATLFANDNTTPQFTTRQKPIVVSQERTFTITLQSNPTTGFSWKLVSYDKNLMAFVGHRYYPPTNKKLMGAPGYEVWTFQANKGNYAINVVGHVRMTYARSWEKTKTPLVSFMVVV